MKLKGKKILSINTKYDNNTKYFMEKLKEQSKPNNILKAQKEVATFLSNKPKYINVNNY